MGPDRRLAGDLREKSEREERDFGEIRVCPKRF